MKKTIKIIIALCILLAAGNPAEAQWSVTGNTGTNATTNFVGTIDNIALKFRTKNVVRMTINTAGKIGIGTTAPIFKLDVKSGSINTDSLYRISGVQVLSRNASNNIQIGDLTTNVGIGTANPLAKLHISAGDASLALFGPNGWGGQLYIGAAPNQGVSLTCQVLVTDGNLHIDPAPNKNIYIGYFQPRDVIINPIGGNVGIGTVSPSSPLHVIGNSVTAGTFTNTVASYDGYGIWSTCSNTPGYGTGVYAQGGQVGVKAGAILAGAGNRYGVLATGSDGEFNVGVYGVATGGNSAIGVFGYAGGPGDSWAGYFNGAAYCSSGTWTSSDRKLKNDIRPLKGALSIIEQLRPSSYTFKTTEYKQMNLPEGLQYGLIADEVQQVIPGAVRKAVQPESYENQNDRSGKKLSDKVEFNTVNYSEMIPILIGAVKEQQQQIEELKSTIRNFDNALAQCCMNYKPGANSSESGADDFAKLEQNAPNPFSENTMIKFYIPQNAGNGVIKVYSNDGSEIKSIPVSTKGIGQAEISGKTLSAGTYTYMLLVDGKVVDTKQMVLTR